MNADLAEVESVVATLERQFGEEPRVVPGVQAARRLNESVLVCLVLLLLVLCVGMGIVSSRFLLTHGSEIWNQFTNSKGAPAEERAIP